MMTIKQFLPVAAGMIILGGTFSFALTLEGKKEQNFASLVENGKRRVRCQAVQSADLRKEVRFSGVTRASKEAVLSFSVSGRLKERCVGIGDTVNAGETVAVLEKEKFINQVAAASASLRELEIQFSQAERDRDRIRILKENNAATKENFEKSSSRADALAASLKAARARLKEAERLFSESMLNAPFNGIITDVRIEPGEWVSPGIPVAKLSGKEAIELELDVPESMVEFFSPGDCGEVVFPRMNNRRVTAVIASISKSGLASGSLFPMTVKLQKARGVVPGLTAEFVIPVKRKSLLFVPIKAVINPGGSTPAVFVERDGSARKVTVKPVAFQGEFVAVKGDIAANDRVVVDGHTALREGDTLLTEAL